MFRESQSKNLVVKANALINASYHLTLAEQQLILSAITQVRRDEPITDEKLYTIAAADLAEMAGFKGNEYPALESAARKLIRRLIKIREKPNGDGATKPRESEIHWVQRCDYLDDQGAVNIRFGKDILPYLTELKSRFTSYDRKLVAKLTSIYAIRLFELMMEWGGTGEQEVEIAWLRKTWADGKYPNIRDLKRRVIEPAVADINTNTDYRISVSYRKRGRVVTWATFKFGPKRKRKKATSTQEPEPQETKPTKKRLPDLKKLSLHEFCNNVARPGEKWDALGRRLIQDGYPAHQVWGMIKKAEAAQAQ